MRAGRDRARSGGRARLDVADDRMEGVAAQRGLGAERQQRALQRLVEARVGHVLQ